VAKVCLVTGGSGYFGSVLVSELIAAGYEVRVLDLNLPIERLPGVRYFQGDIRDTELCVESSQGVNTVFHNVAEVPLAKNRTLFEEVNILGTKNICEAAKANKVEKFIYTSSSAVYGIPRKNPVLHSDEKNPIEEYGHAKLEGEFIARQLISFGIEVKIVRPRTILGSGRLGIFGVLFAWIESGMNIFTLGPANGGYQFIHAKDLAAGIILAADIPGSSDFNLGALEFRSLHDDLQGLCDYAGSGSQVFALPESFMRNLIQLVSRLRLLPFATYQLQLYSKPMFFDSALDWAQLGYSPKYSNLEMLIESYEWFRVNKLSAKSNSASHHQKSVKGKSIASLTLMLRLTTWIQNRIFNS